MSRRASWCHDDQTFKDFVLGRMDGIRDERPTANVPRDVEWETWTTMAFRPHRRLDKTQRLAIEKDFGMRDGVGHIKARKAMLLYTLAYLGLSESNFPPSGLLEKASS